MSDEQNTKIKDGWIEAGATTEQIWKPETVGDKITGIYVQSRQNVGKNKSNVYFIQEDGKEGLTAVWGSTVLDARFGEIPTASQISIEYTGEVAGSRSPYKTFQIFYKPPTEG